jgi:hypothetical protein
MASQCVKTDLIANSSGQDQERQRQAVQTFFVCNTTAIAACPQQQHDNYG